MLDLPHKTQSLSPENRAFLTGLPQTRRFQTPAGELMLCHGVGSDDMAVLRSDTQGYGLQAIHPLRDLMLDPDLQFVVGGHTHDRMVRTFTGLTVINAGTLYREHSPCCLRLDFEALEAVYVTVDGTAEELDRLPIPVPPEPQPIQGAW